MGLRLATFRVLAFAATTPAAIAVLWWTRDFGWFVVALLLALVGSALIERLARPWIKAAERQADLEDRVRNPAD